MAFSSSSLRSAANFSTLMRRQRAVLAVADQRLDGVDDVGIGRIAERAEQGLSGSFMGHRNLSQIPGPPGGRPDGIPHKPVKAA